VAKGGPSGGLGGRVSRKEKSIKNNKKRVSHLTLFQHLGVTNLDFVPTLPKGYSLTRTYYEYGIVFPKKSMNSPGAVKTKGGGDLHHTKKNQIKKKRKKKGGEGAFGS